MNEPNTFGPRWGGPQPAPADTERTEMSNSGGPGHEGDRPRRAEAQSPADTEQTEAFTRPAPGMPPYHPADPRGAAQPYYTEPGSHGYRPDAPTGAAGAPGGAEAPIDGPHRGFGDSGAHGGTVPPFGGPQTHPTAQLPRPEDGAPYGGYGAGPQPQRKRAGRGALVAGALALALVSGGVGGAVGALVTDDDPAPAVTNSLNASPGATPVAAPAGSVQAVAQKVLPSMVTVEFEGDRGSGDGSGVILSSDGLVLTNNHVATGGGPGTKLMLSFNDGSRAEAKVIGADPVSDLAVVKAEGKSGLTAIELGSSNNLQIGQPVVAIGSPLGLAGTVTTGIVSSLNRPVSTNGDAANQATVIDAVQTDAAINPGNSGGALVDMNGKLVGINTAIATLGGGGGGEGAPGASPTGSIGLGFAIPVDHARRIADELTKNGKATHALIGIQVPSRDPANGARVMEVTAGGPADKAGIPKGAVITKVDERRIDAGDALIAAIRSHRPGDTVKVTYTEGSSEKTVDVTLATAPQAGDK